MSKTQQSLLHEAIALVIKESGAPMSTKDIAVIINDRSLYTKKDSSPIESSQISARVNKYLHVFKRTEEGVTLLKGNETIEKKKESEEYVNHQSITNSITELKIKDEDVTNINYLKTNGFTYIDIMGELVKNGLPNIDLLSSCGIYALTIPVGYKVKFLSGKTISTNNNVVKPWDTDRLPGKWVENVEVVYYGLAGSKSFRSLKKRLNDLVRHCSGKTTDRGPHCGGEIIWQLENFDQFGCWVFPTSKPPTPRLIEHELLNEFYKKTGKLPFANRQF